MALQQKSNSDMICDLEGQPLHADSAVLLKSIDKLLTLGAYYSTTHEQYHLAADSAAVAINQAIHPRTHLALEITAEGLLLLDQKVDPNHRNVRQIYELLVPLNIARLEIKTGLSASDLRQALEALQKHNLLLGKTASFKEVIIKNLPPTVCSVSRSVLQNQTDASGGNASAIEDMLAEWSREAMAKEPENEKLAREFMDLVNAIVTNLKKAQAMQASRGTGEGDMVLANLDLDALREGLRRLVDVNPSPRQLLDLINHARSALDLSHDSTRADLVFKVLRKDILEKDSPTANKATPKARNLEYKLTVPQLMDAVRQLDQGASPLENPMAGAEADHLAICLFLLAADPQESLRQILMDSLSRLFARDNIKPEDLDACLTTIQNSLNSGFAEQSDHLVSAIFAALRKGRPELVGILWSRLANNLQPEDLPILWPHLVNDILLGLGRLKPELGRELLTWVGSLSPEGALAQLDRLNTMPALQKSKGSSDLFKAPLPVMFSVHAALAQTSLKPWLSRGIHSSLKARPFSLLSGALISCLQTHDPANLPLFLDLMAHPKSSSLPDELRDRAGVLLTGFLEMLPRKRRSEKWVPSALKSLAQLQYGEAQDFLHEVVHHKRWLFFKDWPEACVAAVRAEMSQEENRG